MGWYSFLVFAIFVYYTITNTRQKMSGFYSYRWKGTVVMGNWFCDKKSIENRGLIFGLWTCHQYLGDITAAVCTAAVLSVGFDYTYALLIPACTNVVWAYVTMKLIADPADVDIITPEVKVRLAKLKEKELETGMMTAADQGKTPITYATAIPLVANYALAYGFFKLTNYVLFFWLPYFLGKHFDPVTANLIASLYSVGMMAGGIIVGVVSDLFGGRRACVIGTFMGCLMIFLYVFSKKSEELSAAALLVMLTIMGILVGGPNSIITSAVAADLASHPSIQGNNKSLGTMTGLINGCGSITASVGLLAVGPLQEAFGWSSVWLFLMGSVFTGTALMGGKMYKELFPAPSHSSL
jgi:OPA family glycerol-3-phosphate transporter-like MFS transporter 1/2